MTLDNDNGTFDNLYQDLLDRAMDKVVSRRRKPGRVDEEAISDDLDLLLETRVTHDLDLLRAVAEHGSSNRVTSIAAIARMLREDQPGDVSHLITADIITTHELVLGICVLVRWNSDQGMPRGDTDQIVKHAVVHPEDANDIVAVVRERSILQYEGVMAIIHAMRANPSPVLAVGTL